MSICKKSNKKSNNPNIQLYEDANIKTNCSCNCMNRVDKDKYNYVYNIKSGRIANKCLNIPSVDERHMNRFADCIDIVTEMNCDIKNTKILGLTFDDMRFNPYNNNPMRPVCEQREIRKCYEK